MLLRWKWISYVYLLPDRRRNANTAVLGDSALRSEVSLGPHETFCLQAALVINKSR